MVKLWRSENATIKDIRQETSNCQHLSRAILSLIHRSQDMGSSNTRVETILSCADYAIKAYKELTIY